MRLFRRHTYHLTGEDPDFVDIFVNGPLNPYKWNHTLKCTDILIRNNIRLIDCQVPFKSEFILFEMKLNVFQAMKVRKIVKHSNKNWSSYGPRKLKYVKW